MILTGCKLGKTQVYFSVQVIKKLSHQDDAVNAFGIALTTGEILEPTQES